MWRVPAPVSRTDTLLQHPLAFPKKPMGIAFFIKRSRRCCRAIIHMGRHKTCPCQHPILVPGSWFLVLSSQFPVLSSWFLVLGSWFLVPGSWFSVLSSWFLVLGSWFLVLGSWFSVLGSRFLVPGSQFSHRRRLFLFRQLTQHVVQNAAVSIVGEFPFRVDPNFYCKREL